MYKMSGNPVFFAMGREARKLRYPKAVKIARIAPVAAVLLVFLAVAPAFLQAADESTHEPWLEYYEHWVEYVEYKNGEISVAFDDTPIDVALYHIRARTGLEIVIPSASEHKSLNLRLKRLSLEPAVRSLLSSIGFNSFALMYDEGGRPSRAIVLVARPDEPRSASPTDEDRAPEILTAKDKEELQKQLERWSDLQPQDRARIEEQLKRLPPSEDREVLVREYGRQVLGLRN